MHNMGRILRELCIKLTKRRTAICFEAYMKRIEKTKKQCKEGKQKVSRQRHTMNRFLHKGLPKSLPMYLNKIFFLHKIIQFLIRCVPIYKRISWNWDSTQLQALDFLPEKEKFKINKRTHKREKMMDTLSGILIGSTEIS